MLLADQLSILHQDFTTGLVWAIFGGAALGTLLAMFRGMF